MRASGACPAPRIIYLCEWQVLSLYESTCRSSCQRRVPSRPPSGSPISERARRSKPYAPRPLPFTRRGELPPRAAVSRRESALPAHGSTRQASYKDLTHVPSPYSAINTRVLPFPVWFCIYFVCPSSSVSLYMFPSPKFSFTIPISSLLISSIQKSVWQFQTHAH